MARQCWLVTVVGWNAVSVCSSPKSNSFMVVIARCKMLHDLSPAGHCSCISRWPERWGGLLCTSDRLAACLPAHVQEFKSSGTHGRMLCWQEILLKGLWHPSCHAQHKTQTAMRTC